ncbi:uncharacterized protein LOC110699550 [Chenopodium quinoa]|uniref:uncharacterized protein LOC110699550 n=1 Tax=Chenopodium quinoa TaxID=63459 RepID=UPI000B79A6B6|nr:uncharacterized protein LOC110699550 [Chenopodium quinoa]
MLKTHISRLASNSSPSSSSSSSSSTIPSQGVNQKPLYEVTTRSGKVVGSDPLVKEEPQEEVELENEGERANEPLSVDKEKDVEVPKDKVTPLPLNCQPREEKLPFLQQFVRTKLDAQFGKFLAAIKNLHVSLPFVDAMKQMPHYYKFLKDLLSGRRECETVNLTANCSAILSNKHPTKLKGPGSFSNLCSINGVKFEKALCDLEARVAVDEDERIPIILGVPFLAISIAIIVKEGKMTL